MARVLQICICSFLLVVIAGNEFLFAEGRQIKTLNKQSLESSKDDKGFINQGKEVIGSNQASTGYQGDLQKTQTNYDVPETKRVLPKMSSNVPKSSTEFGSSMAEHVNGFQPTAPGNSPGVGHSHEGRKQMEQNIPSAKSSEGYFLEGSTDDFRPTGPGRSPGVGHSVRNTKEEPKF
ncbi:OLC1v1010123C1 [Oldenlandia corymbosa var. corymbosa]|uniref:OLC1v1010123C1 n=1 Tax=Oldenlandia corymbosa var. corymbosa TaxID=529605 RepID=A0AAV1DS59_OLDCO|nr:OLC1v1010123C1 [Oldenlandia corymbosa var. corymbosa]